MENLIERYIYDVTRRLPEKDRDEVSKELNANIYDMLSEHADENEAKEVLYKLGSPASLAEKYRQKPRYLISPAIYDDYIRVLKWIIPLVSVVLLTVGMVLGAIDAIKDSMVNGAYFISNILSKGISMGVSGALQALAWTTAAYAITERVSTKRDGDKNLAWKFEDLPNPIPNTKGSIPLSDSVTELILTIIFSVAAILVCSGVFPITFSLQASDIQIVNLFNPDFLTSCIPPIAIIALLDICECIAKIKDRQWTALVCGTVVISNLTGMGISLYLINRSDLFSTQFTSFVQSKEWGSFDLLRFVGKGVTNPVIVLISFIIVICSLAGCGSAIYKTVKKYHLL